MSKRKIKDKLWELYKNDDPKVKILQCTQKRPYTFVYLHVRYKDRGYVDYHFCKVCWPDTWNAEFGKELAIKKTLADIAQQIVNDDWAQDALVDNPHNVTVRVR